MMAFYNQDECLDFCLFNINNPKQKITDPIIIIPSNIQGDGLISPTSGSALSGVVAPRAYRAK